MCVCVWGGVTSCSRFLATTMSEFSVSNCSFLPFKLYPLLSLNSVSVVHRLCKGHGPKGEEGTSAVLHSFMLWIAAGGGGGVAPVFKDMQKTKKQKTKQKQVLYVQESGVCHCNTTLHTKRFSSLTFNLTCLCKCGMYLAGK